MILKEYGIMKWVMHVIRIEKYHLYLQIILENCGNLFFNSSRGIISLSGMATGINGDIYLFTSDDPSKSCLYFCGKKNIRLKELLFELFS